MGTALRIHTIGWTQRPARDLFETLRQAGIEQVVDIRLRNSGQLAGYTKRGDLEFVVGEILGAGYLHEPHLTAAWGGEVVHL